MQILCTFEDFGKIRNQITDLGHEIDYEKSGTVYKPMNLVEVSAG